MLLIYSRSTMWLTAVATNADTGAAISGATVTASLFTAGDEDVKLENGDDLGELTLGEITPAGRYRVRLPATLDEEGTPPAWAVVRAVKDSDQHQVRCAVMVIDDTT